jgi:hypothetical protein
VSDATQELLPGLEQRTSDPRLGHVKGTVRIDVEDGDQVASWLVTLDRGSIAVTRGDGADAACVVRTNRETLEGMTQGRVNATAAMLRGTVRAHGDIELLLYIQRLFPPPSPDVVSAGPARRRTS